MGFGGGLAVGLALGSDTVTAAAAAPTVSVAEWSDLGALDVPDDCLVAVTGESGITSAIVQWDESGGEWQVVDVVCTYAARAAAGWAATAGEWYDSGGVTVVTAEGARCVDTTYDVQRRWSGTVSAWVAPEAYAGTLAESAAPLVGDDATPAGWTVTDTDGSGTADVSVVGTAIQCSATCNSGAGGVIAALTSNTDASLSSAGNAWVEALVHLSAFSSGTNGAVQLAFTLTDGTNSYTYGSQDYPGISQVFDGKWWATASTGSGIANSAYAQQATISGDLETAETLLELMKVGAVVAVRVGGAAGRWQALAGVNANTTAAKTWQLRVSAFRTSGTQTATVTIRHGRFLRF